MTNPYSAYENNYTQIESKEDLLIKTYEEILSLLNIAKFALQENDIKTKAESITKITDAILVLKASLDKESGREIAENLDKLYDFCIEELLKANTLNKEEHIQNVIEVLTPIYEGFKEARKNLNENR
ncbi:MAG TPA: flagellar export chaperone FliS [Persephonella sp.]|nr:flagellar export chaperone FliS [Hydrogenothermaceae bacterium]HIQ24539.1 flagellar export chaperone FliS [Persephonella sp.]